MLLLLATIAKKYYSLKETDPLIPALAVEIIKVLGRINPNMLNLQQFAGDNICYVLYNEPIFSMSLFVFRKGHEMPIHSHPKMTVYM